MEEQHQIEEEAEMTRSNGRISAVEQIRQRRDQLAEQREPEEFDIPGYNGALVAKYQVIPWLRMQKIEERALKSRAEKRLLGMHADVICAACVGIYYRDDEGKLKAVDPAERGEAACYDEHLAEFLGIEGAKSARAVLFQTFNNDLAVTAHYGDITAWMQGEEEEVDDEALGES